MTNTPFLHKRLKKYFHLRDGEVLTSSLLSINIFLIISILLLIKPIVTSLFITHFGIEQLPFAFILVAGSAGIFTYIYGRLVQNFSIYRLIVGFHLFSIISLISFAALLYQEVSTPVVLYAFYIWVALFALISTTQYWTFANVVYSARQAKRIFPMLGSGAIAGGIVGGYLASIFVPIIGNISMLVLSTVLFIPCIFITRYIHRQNDESDEITSSKSSRPVKYPIQVILKSKHLQYLAAIIALSVVVSKLVDYQFSDFAHKAYSDPVALTAFFGRWYSSFNVISLLLQLLLTRRIVKNWGIGPALLFLPGSLLLASGLLIAFPILGVAIFLKMNDGSLKQSINKAAVELLSLPIPDRVKSQIKAFIDVFIDSVATGLAGIFLIVIVRTSNFDTEVISSLIIVCTILWIYFAHKVRRAYIKAFQTRTAAIINPELMLGSGPSFSKKKIFNMLLNGSASQIHALLQDRNLPFKRARLIPALEKLLHHKKSHIRISALKYLAHLQREKGLDKLKVMIADPTQEVKQETFAVLLHYQYSEGVGQIQEYLENPSLDIKMAALVGLCMEVRRNKKLGKYFKIDEVIKKSIDSIPQMRLISEQKFTHIQVLKGIGMGRIESGYPFIDESLGHQDADIVSTAIEAAIKTKDRRFLKAILFFFMEKKFRRKIIELMPHLGVEGIGLMSRAMEKGHVSSKILRSYIVAVRKIGDQKSVNFLFELVGHEDERVAQRAISALVKMKKKFPGLYYRERRIKRKIKIEVDKLKKLISLRLAAGVQYSFKLNDEVIHNFPAMIKNDINGSINIILSLLSLKYDVKYLELIKSGLLKPSRTKKLFALDFLAELFEAKDRNRMLPILEAATMRVESEEKIRAINVKPASTRMIKRYAYKKLNDIKRKLLAH